MTGDIHISEGEILQHKDSQSMKEFIEVKFNDIEEANGEVCKIFMSYEAWIHMFNTLGCTEVDGNCEKVMLSAGIVGWFWGVTIFTTTSRDGAVWIYECEEISEC